LASFLALLPRSLTTFLFALAALLRFYGNTDTEFLHLTSLGWSLLAFSLGSAALVANLGLEWNAGRRSHSQAEDERLRAEEERLRAREREARRDDLADEERRKADRERERAARRARIQNRWIILQVQHQLADREDTRAALADFVAFLQEYGE
jgi:regulator of protease activity HflC (stomatin/prohibitin superfamily)